MKIESINNPKVKEWSKLKEKKYRDQTDLFIVEDRHLVEEAYKYKEIVELIGLDPTLGFDGVPFYEVNEAIMKKLSSQASSTKIMAVCKKRKSEDIRGNVCVLDCIQDPGNLGTIIRSAVAFNIDTIIMSNDCVDLYNEKTIRATEGMLFKMNFIRGDLKNILEYLRHQGYNIYGTSVVGGSNLKKIEFKEKNAIIIGNEGKGMKEEYRKFCDNLIYIPMDNCESLNAAVAASIIFYEMSDKNEI